MLLESTLDVLWDPDGLALQLVAVGDPMWEPARLTDGRQEVQLSEPLRSVGALATGRGNESWRLVLALAEEMESPAAALARRFKLALLAPRGAADVLIRFAAGGGAQYRLKNCAVESWPHDQTEHLTKQRLEVLGGELIADVGTYNLTVGWGVGYYVRSDGSVYLRSDTGIYIRNAS